MHHLGGVVADRGDEGAGAALPQRRLVLVLVHHHHVHPVVVVGGSGGGGLVVVPVVVLVLGLVVVLLEEGLKPLQLLPHRLVVRAEAGLALRRDGGRERRDHDVRITG